MSLSAVVHKLIAFPVIPLIAPGSGTLKVVSPWVEEA